MVCNQASLQPTDADTPGRLGIAGAALAAFAALLPFQALGPWQVTSWLRFELGDWLVAAASPWLLQAIWRARARVQRSWIVRGWVAFSIAGTLGWLANGSFGGATELARVWAPLFVVAALVAVEPAVQRRVTSAAIGGGWAALALGLIGYILAAAGVLPRVHGDPLFAHQSAHPVFDGLIRFAGTFASCQSMGDYLVVWLGLVAVHSPARRQRLLGLAVGSAAIGLTFASSWIALPLVLAANAPRVVATRSAVLAAIGLCFAASWLMNFGVPDTRVDPDRPTLEAPCSTLDLEHYVTQIATRDRRSCIQLVELSPYRSPLSTYRHAKEVAWDAFTQSPWFGIGSGRFREAARADVARRFQVERPTATFYQSPHSVILGALAERGVAGGLALALLGWALLGTSRWPLALGLMLIGLNADLLHHRFFWLFTAYMMLPVGPGIEHSGGTPPESIAQASVSCSNRPDSSIRGGT